MTITHRGRLSNAEKLLIEREKKGEKLHPVNIMAAQLIQLMDDFHRQYWTSEAKHKRVSLQVMVERYLIGDWGIKDPSFKYTVDEKVEE